MTDKIVMGVDLARHDGEMTAMSLVAMGSDGIGKVLELMSGRDVSLLQRDMFMAIAKHYPNGSVIQTVGDYAELEARVAAKQVIERANIIGVRADFYSMDELSWLHRNKRNKHHNRKPQPNRGPVSRNSW